MKNVKSIKNKTKNFVNLISAKLSSNVSYGLIVLMTSAVVLNCPSSSSSNGDGGTSGGASTPAPAGPQTLRSIGKLTHGTTNGPMLADDDQFGSSIANVGDLDGDGGGATVIAVGVPGDDAVGFARGAIYLLSYDVSGTLTATSKVGHGATITPSGGTSTTLTLADNTSFGSAIASVGDLDGGDDETVIAVGAIGDDTTGDNAVVGNDRGAIHLLSYNANGTLTKINKVANGTPNGPMELANRDFFGFSIANVGDLDGGDDETVIAVGAPGFGGELISRGAIYLLSYNASGTLTNTDKIGNGTDNGPTLGDFDFFGTSIANVGDLYRNGDTVIAVGASGDNTGGNRRGAIYLLSYNASGTLTGTTKVTSITPNGPMLADGDFFGISVANLGDLYRNSGTVIAVGANQDKAGGGGSSNNRGAIHLLSYNASGTLTGTTKIAHGTTTTDGTSTSLTLVDNDEFGFGIANVGDLYRNGGTVIAVGANQDDTGGSDSSSNRGAIHLLSYQ